MRREHHGPVRSLVEELVVAFALEIRVANLWPNRMIGDASLPQNERFTWSSYEPFTKDSPLPKSGLLGPVVIHGLEKVTLP